MEKVKNFNRAKFVEGWSQAGLSAALQVNVFPIQTDK
jgi:hypothetical protein